MSGPVSSAVVSEIVGRTVSFLSSKCSEHKNVHEWIHRLEMTRIKIKSAVQESEVLDIDIDEPLHEWQEKLKMAVCEAEEALSKFQARTLHEKPNQTVEGRSSSCDQPMQEEGYDNATLGLPASNLRKAVPRQVKQNQLMQEEGSDDATLVDPASIIRDSLAPHVHIEANLSHDPSMQEGSDDATLVHPASNLRESVTRQVNLEANFSQDESMEGEGSNDATLVHDASNLRESVARQVILEANFPHDQSMEEEGSDDETLVHPASNLLEAITCQVNLEENLTQDESMQEEGSNDATLVTDAALIFLKSPSLDSLWRFLEPDYWETLMHTFHKILDYRYFDNRLRFLRIFRNLSSIAGVVNNRRILFGESLENDEKVSKLIKTVEKLEKMAGDIGDFIKLLELQSKRKMCRKRKRSGVALQSFFWVISLKLQTYALFCYREDPYLPVIMMFRANCDIPTGITSDIFIGLII